MCYWYLLTRTPPPGLLREKGVTKDVAVKTLKPEAGDVQRHELLQEWAQKERREIGCFDVHKEGLYEE